MTDGPATLSAASMARLAAVVLAAFYLPPLLIYVGIIPFVILQLLAVAAVFIWPELVLWLPRKMYGSVG